MNHPELIKETVKNFYQKATVDFLIGYHFRKIAAFEGANPLAPPLEAFSNHLPRIELFWRIQLLGEQLGPEDAIFSLIEKHRPMKLKSGEINRWVQLFNETIDQMENIHPDPLWNLWREKIDHFRNIFLRTYKQN